MGIDPSAVNVRDLEITRPSRRGPGGDLVGTPTVLGTALQALRVDEEKFFRGARGVELVSFARFFMDPFADDAGDVVALEAGDFASYSNGFGVAVEPQEIVQVATTEDCSGVLDVVTFRVGRARVVVE
ncbi:MAG: hypothetical protein GY898_06125 [Proteobacteria bacterium]|nr:hypothetical protein [Pseudomonadota bacterium]